jgi:hypothetical protein
MQELIDNATEIE